ncbi:major yolk protein-like [Patiria miniata]|uniref:Major yolk protein n=1 Tax=Patiria miniata TaxID=46514 RepID=A0A913Z2F2_PATMI|nr:major yolk protein-like [Patiria miniata]
MKLLLLVAVIGVASAFPFADLFDEVTGHHVIKPGQCPVISADSEIVGVCVSNCRDDSQCDGAQKCCKTPCGGAMCLDAVIPEPDQRPVPLTSEQIERQWQDWVETKRQMVQKLQRFPQPPRFFTDLTNTRDAIRVCTSNPCEWKKCERMASTFTYNLKPRKEWACALATSPEHCMDWVEQGFVDMVITRNDDIYTAKTKYNLLPIIHESTETKQAPPSEWQNITLAVTKITSDIDTLAQMENRQVCIPKANSTASFKTPIGRLIQEGIIPRKGDFVQSAGEFFSESCVPGVLDRTFDKNGTYPVSLVARCEGEAAVRYEGIEGAVRCLQENVGEVTFLDHKKIQSLLLEDTIPSAVTQFKLICMSGSQPLTEWETKDCHVGRVPQPTIYINPRRSDLKTVIQDLLVQAVQLYSSKSVGTFKLFDSAEYTCPSGRNVDILFKQESNVFINIDEMIKPHAEPFFRVMQTVDKLVPKTMCRVCVIQPELYEGCKMFKGMFEHVEVASDVAWGCVLAQTKMECMQAVMNGTADLMTANPTEMFIAGREFKLQPFMSQEFDTLNPQVDGKSQFDNTTFTYTIAVMTKDRLLEKYGDNVRFLNMTGLKTCHAGISKLSSFKHPIGWLLANGTIPRIGSVFESVSRFFEKSCLPGVTPRTWTWDKDLILGQELNWGFPGFNFYNFTGYEWFNMNMPNTWNYYNWKGMSPRFFDVFFKTLNKNEIKELLSLPSLMKTPFLRKILSAQPSSLRDLSKLLDRLPEEIHGLDDETLIPRDQIRSEVTLGIDGLIRKLKAMDSRSWRWSAEKSNYRGKSLQWRSTSQPEDPVLTSLLSNIASKYYNIEEQLTEFLEYINESPSMMDRQEEEFSWITHPAIKSFLQVYSRRFVNVDLFDNVALREHEFNRYFNPIWNSPQIGDFLERTKVHQERLCSACAGVRESNCTETLQEPYSNFQGSVECLRNRAGDIAFLEAHTAQRVLRSARMTPNEVVMVCRSGEVIDFTIDEEILKKCSFGAVPHSTLMTAYNRTGSWRWNVTKALLHAQRQFDISPMAEVFVPSPSSFKFQPIPLINQTYEVYLGPMLLRSFEALVKPSSYDWWKAKTNVCWGETYTNVLTQRNGTCNAIVKDVTCAGSPSPIVVSVGRVGDKKKILVPMCSRPTDFKRQMAEFLCDNGATYLKSVMAPTTCECVPCEEISTQPTWNRDEFWMTEDRMFVPRQYEDIKNQWGNEAFWADTSLNVNFDLEDAITSLKDIQLINQRTISTKKAPSCEKPWIGEEWHREWFPGQSSIPVCEQKTKTDAVKKIQMIVGQTEQEQHQ